jgi:hypothetical protein
MRKRRGGGVREAQFLGYRSGVGHPKTKIFAFIRPSQSDGPDEGGDEGPYLSEGSLVAHGGSHWEAQ